MCVPCNHKILSRLKIPMMVKKTNDKYETPLVSVDSIKTHTGMSVYDRLKTISTLLDEKSNLAIFKNLAIYSTETRKKLLLERKGHTESSIELMKLAKLKEMAIIVEIINDNGTMAKENL